MTYNISLSDEGYIYIFFFCILEKENTDSTNKIPPFKTQRVWFSKNAETNYMLGIKAEHYGHSGLSLMNYFHIHFKVLVEVLRA